MPLSGISRTVPARTPFHVLASNNVATFLFIVISDGKMAQVTPLYGATLGEKLNGNSISLRLIASRQHGSDLYVRPTPTPSRGYVPFV